ncbi:MAG: hypothetical protein ABR507_11595, partial [Actinomycetota bacterium]
MQIGGGAENGHRLEELASAVSAAFAACLGRPPQVEVEMTHLDCATTQVPLMNLVSMPTKVTGRPIRNVFIGATQARRDFRHKIWKRTCPKVEARRAKAHSESQVVCDIGPYFAAGPGGFAAFVIGVPQLSGVICMIGKVKSKR